MSDIAMLVAEEYERRKANNLKKAGAGVAGEGEFDMLLSRASLLALTGWLKQKIGVEKWELVNWVSEPKTQIAIAASNSFFSA